MRNKLLLCIIVPLFMSGCASSSIEYVENESTSVENVTVESSSVHVPETEDLWDDSRLDGQLWDDRLNAVASDGNEYSVIIKAEIDLPYENEEISVYEFEYNKQLSPEKKKKIAESLFGVGEVYKYDDKLRPKQFYQYMLDLCQKELADAKTEADRTRLQQAIASHLEDYDAAPDELIPADDYSGSNYLGYIDGAAFRLDFGFYEDMEIVRAQERDWESNPMYLGPNFIIPGIQQFHNFSVTYERLDYDSIGHEEWMDTNDKCQERIQKIVDLLGFDEMTATNEAFLPEGSTDYFVNYTQGPKKIYPSKVTYPNVAFCEKEGGLTIPYPSSLIQGMFRKGDWLGVMGYSYCELLSKEKGVKMMSFETVIEIIKNELKENFDRYKGYTQMVSYDSLELAYYEYANETGDKIMMLPCWCLSSTKNVGNPVYVNALDGTVVYLPDPSFYFLTEG